MNTIEKIENKIIIITIIVIIIIVIIIIIFIALSRQFGSFQKRKMLMNRVAVRALELILCRLRAMLQGYLFKYPACLQEPSKTDLKPIL